MNNYQLSQRCTSASSLGAPANPDWRPWMYQSFAASSLESQDDFIPEHPHEAPPPYPEYNNHSNNFRTSRNYGFPPQFQSSQLPETNPSRADRNFPAKTASQFHQSSYPQILPYDTNGTGQSSSALPTSYTSPSYPPGTPTTSPSDEAILSQALDFMHHTAPAPTFIPRLPRSIAIPQTMHGRGQSFLRAWAPCLQAFNISQTDFLAFIDNLNVVSTANPPLQVLNMAGGFLGMVPHHWAHLAGTAMQATARLGTAVVSKSRTDMYMNEVNEKMFKPRGLRVSIASTDAMRAILRIPNTVPVLVPLTAHTMQMSTLDRELLAVEQYNAALSLDVPRPAEQTTLLAKLSARQVEGLAKKNQKKAVKEREKALEKQAKRDRENGKRAEKREREEEKKDRKREKKDRKKHENFKQEIDDDATTDSDGYQIDHRRKDKKDKKEDKDKDKKSKEEKHAEKVLWIVVENLKTEMRY